MQTTQQSIIGNQVKLSIAKAFAISLQGIKIRLGRALVTLSGVLLGIAFLMSILTTELINRTTQQEQELIQRTSLMMTTVKSEVGELKGRNIALYLLGDLDETESRFVNDIAHYEKAKLQVYGGNIKGATKVSSLEELGKESPILIILGDKTSDTPINLDVVINNLSQPVVVDSVANRAEFTINNYRYLSFFGDSSTMEVSNEEVAQKAKQERFRTIWIVVISLLVTVIGIANALLMSVTERFKEIGTMKCLGALSSFIRQMFLIESALIGVAGSFLGALVGALFPLITYGFTLGFGIVFTSMNYGMLVGAIVLSIIAGTILSIIAAIYPATFASKMIPAMALRSNV